MSRNGITCEVVDQGDLDTRYLAGQLSPEGAEAFEAHFFGCERCWGLVQQGQAVRSAFQADSPVRSPALPASSPRATRQWWGLAAAAVVAVAFGVWQIALRPEASLPEDVFRGEGTPFAVAATADSASLTASWPRVAEAEVYRVRLYAADGMMTVERETPDTSVTVPVDSVTGAANTGMLWQVQALDRLRQPIARSDLTEAVRPPLRP